MRVVQVAFTCLLFTSVLCNTASFGSCLELVSSLSPRSDDHRHDHHQSSTAEWASTALAFYNLVKVAKLPRTAATIAVGRQVAGSPHLAPCLSSLARLADETATSWAAVPLLLAAALPTTLEQAAADQERADNLGIHLRMILTDQVLSSEKKASLLEQLSSDLLDQADSTLQRLLITLSPFLWLCYSLYRTLLKRLEIPPLKLWLAVIMMLASCIVWLYLVVLYVKLLFLLAGFYLTTQGKK